MPFSSNSGKAAITKVVEKLNPKRVLDVGAGCGTYSRMFRKPGQHWTAIEIWKPYIEKYKLRDLYDIVIREDVRTWLPSEHYDLAFAGDILEHMTALAARNVLAKLREAATTVIVSIPLGYYPQGEYDGNPYEEHIVDHWTDEAVRRVLGEPTWSTIDNEIGVYVYSRGKVQAMKIAVYTISKNEEQFVERFVNSAKDADYIVIADTGSTDRTVEKARELGVQAHSIYINPWRFDTARNAALALVPADADICVSLDMDEVLEPGWRKKIEDVWYPDTTRLRYGFDWGHGIVFQYEKIHARKGYLWHHPCHEYPVPDGRTTESYAYIKDILVTHKPDPTKSRGQYMELLELSVKEDPNCPRNAFYYARELTFHSRWNEAIGALHKYLDMPNATWINERCYAMRLLGKSYDAIGDGINAMAWFRRACAEAPYTREPWVDLALACYCRSMWAESYAAARNALAITHRELVYTCDPEVWGAKPHDLLAIAAYNLGLYNEAAEHGAMALKHEPENERFKNNLEWYVKKLAQEVTPCASAST